jgi:hypothetical protein
MMMVVPDVDHVCHGTGKLAAPAGGVKDGERRPGYRVAHVSPGSASPWTSKKRSISSTA